MSSGLIEAQRRSLGLFHSPDYIRHNARRLEHLASLRLPIHDATVLEIGAGIGDHTTFYLDRGCTVTSLEARAENCQNFIEHLGKLRSFEDQRSRVSLIAGDAQFLAAAVDGSFEIVHCYGLLYHLEDPESALGAMATLCTKLLLLETCVSFGHDERLNPVEEPPSPTQAALGRGCRPTRPWIMSRLKRLFPHVYVPKTQPAHDEFPLDWSAPPPGADPRALKRSVFVAARAPVESDLLLTELPMQQDRG